MLARTDLAELGDYDSGIIRNELWEILARKIVGLAAVIYMESVDLPEYYIRPEETNVKAVMLAGDTYFLRNYFTPELRFFYRRDIHNVTGINGYVRVLENSATGTSFKDDPNGGKALVTFLANHGYEVAFSEADTADWATN